MPTTFYVSLAHTLGSPYSLCSDHALVVLQALVREVNELGGKAASLRLDYRGGEKNDVFSLRTGVEELVRDALVKFPTLLKGDAPPATWRAVRQILAEWGSRRRFVSLTAPVAEADRWKYRADADINLRRLADFESRDMAVSFNPSHPKATRLFSVDAKIDKTGRLYVVLTFGYPRDSSSWTISHFDADRTSNDAWASFGAKLVQREDEDGPVALARIVDEIESVLVPLQKPNVVGYSVPEAHREALRRESFFSQTHAALRESARGACGDFWTTYSKKPAPDMETLARFGYAEDRPYQMTEELASMLADQLARSHTTEAELALLIDGMKRARRFRKANGFATAFCRSISNRNWGAVDAERQPTPGPDYAALDECAKETSAQSGAAWVWIPSARANGGLIQVPFARVQFDRSTNRITYRGHSMDVGVIRQIDCLPKGFK